MSLRQFLLLASPNNWNTKPESKPCFKVDPASMPGEIGYDKSALPYFSNNRITNLVIMFLQIHAQCLIASYITGFNNTMFPDVIQTSGL